MSKLLPLFPLQLVVFPRTQLPLHIFEDRYKEMVGEAIRHRSEFGIVLTKGEGIAKTGCTVAVEKVIAEYPDGRLDILTFGRRRFEIVYLNQEKSYLQGEVEFYDDETEETAPEELKDKVIRSYRDLIEAGASGNTQSVLPDPVMNDSQLSFQLAQAVPDVDFQNNLLHSRSELERLQQLAEFLDRYVPRAKLTAHMRRLAPRNGFGHRIAGA